MQQLDKWNKELMHLSIANFKETDNALYNHYKDALKKMKIEIKGYIDEYENLSFSKRLEVERQLQVANKIDIILMDLNKWIQSDIRKGIEKQIEVGYYGTWYALEGSENIQLDFALLPEKYIEELVNKPVNGMRFSSRLYNHRKELAERVTTSLLNGATAGKGYRKIAKEVGELTEANYKQALRIARTEGGRVQSISKQHAYQEAKAKGVRIQKQWMATLDRKTRHQHQILDGQIVEIEEQFEFEGNKADGPRLFGVAGLDINCRCTTITVVNGISPEVRKDNETKQLMPFKNYDEWFEYKKKRAESGIIGLETSDGIVIKEIAEHLFERMIQRGVSFSDTKDALTNPLEIKKDKVDDKGRSSRKYVGEKTSVVINPVTGNIITTHKTSSKTVKRLKKRGGPS